jgi:hypothetical protein
LPDKLQAAADHLYGSSGQQRSEAQAVCHALLQQRNAAVFGGALRDAAAGGCTPPKDIDVSVCTAFGEDFASKAMQLAEAALQAIQQDVLAPAGHWSLKVLAGKTKAQPARSSARPQLQLLRLRAGKDGGEPTVSWWRANGELLCLLECVIVTHVYCLNAQHTSSGSSVHA